MIMALPAFQLKSLENSKVIAARLFCFLVVFGVSLGGCGALAEQRLGYEPIKVELSGTILAEEFYGPPNYGENPATDSKEQVLILNLDAPINVIAVLHTGPDQDSYYNERHVQLVDLANLPLTDFIGQHVSLYGTLFEKENGHHHTDVLMDVQNIVRPTGTSL